MPSGAPNLRVLRLWANVLLWAHLRHHLRLRHRHSVENVLVESAHSVWAKRTEHRGIAALEQERAKLVAFVLEILNGYSEGEVGDIDGGWLEDFALEHGFLEAKPESADDPLYCVAEWLKAASLAALRDVCLRTLRLAGLRE